MMEHPLENNGHLTDLSTSYNDVIKAACPAYPRGVSSIEWSPTGMLAFPMLHLLGENS